MHVFIRLLTVWKSSAHFLFNPLLENFHRRDITHLKMEIYDYMNTWFKKRQGLWDAVAVALVSSPSLRWPVAVQSRSLEPCSEQEIGPHTCLSKNSCFILPEMWFRPITFGWIPSLPRGKVQSFQEPGCHSVRMTSFDWLRTQPRALPKFFEMEMLYFEDVITTSFF